MKFKFFWISQNTKICIGIVQSLSFLTVSVYVVYACFLMSTRLHKWDVTKRFYFHGISRNINEAIKMSVTCDFRIITSV